MFETTDTSISTAVMFGSDAYYYDPQDFDINDPPEGEEDLPFEYSPVWKMPDPWFNASLCKADFLLVAEFSELEGPKPLITIPQKVSGNFDLNEFSVRIMTVDCQSHASDSFRVHEDRSIVLSEAKDGIYAYVHHFTLYDSKARGFVRPFCMALVTSNYEKLEVFYEEMKKEFDEVCWKMKQGNLLVFVKDMTYHLTDLQYTKEKYLEYLGQQSVSMEIGTQTTGVPAAFQNAEEELILQSLSVDSLNTAIQEVRHILQTISALIQSFEVSEDLHDYMDVLVSCNGEETINNSPNSTPLPEPVMANGLEGSTMSSHQSSSSSQAIGLPKRLRRSPCLSSSFQYSCSLGENAVEDRDKTPVFRKRSSSFSDISSPCTVGADPHCYSYEPKLVRTTNKRRYDKTLRSLHELCLTSAKHGLNRLRYIQKYFAKDLATLKLEKCESEVLEPNRGLLTIGRTVQMNFIQPNMPDVSLRQSQSATFSDLYSDETSSYQSAESFLSCEDLSGERTAGGGAVVLSSSLEDVNWATNSFDETQESSILNTTMTSSISSSVSSVGSSMAADTVSHSTQVVDSLTDSGHFPDTSSNFTLTHMASGALHSTENENESSNCDCDSPLKVFSLPDQIYSMSKKTPGFGILKLMQRYSFAPHLLFSLLCGRPLVVMGSKRKEDDIRNIVNTLSFFVPNRGRNEMLPPVSFVHPITLGDLSKHRILPLVSTTKLPRDKVIPKSVEKLCTVFDLDSKLMYGPGYQEGTLTEIYRKRKVFSTDTTYLLHIHSQLQDLSMKAYIFYNTFIVNVSCKLSDMYSDPEEARMAYGKAERCFLESLRLSPHDTEIIKSLAMVVQEQVNKQGCQNGQTDTGAYSPKLHNVPSQLFK